MAAESGNAEIVEMLLARGANMNAMSKSLCGEIPVFATIAERKRENPSRIREILLAKITKMEKAGGNMPIHWAAKNNRPAVVRMLLDKGVDVNVRNNNGQTPLHLAAKASRSWQHIASLQIRVAEEKKERRRALYCAARQDAFETIKVLLEREGIDINIRDFDGKTPLGYAKGVGGDSDIAKKLQEQGAIL